MSKAKNKTQKMVPVTSSRCLLSRSKFQKLSAVPAEAEWLNLHKIDTIFGADFDAQECLDLGLESVRDRHDFILIDCPPKQGTATQMAFLAATGVIIPTECSPARRAFL